MPPHDESIDPELDFLKQLSLEERKGLLASVIGISVEQMDENGRRYVESQKYMNLPPNQWPEFEINWDLSAEGKAYVLDINEPGSFDLNFPEGLILGEVDFQELDQKLAPYSRRTLDETWEVGFPDKVARGILHLVEGRKLTPSQLRPQEGMVQIGNGHHRVAIVRAKGITILPFYAQPADKEELSRLLVSARWM